MKEFSVLPRQCTVIVMLIATVGFSLACHGGTGGYVWVRDVPPMDHRAAMEPLRTGDHVIVVVHGQDTMGGDFEVRPGGEVVLPSIGPVPASGSTPEQLSALIRDRMRGLLTDPKVSVALSLRKTIVSVIGEVKTPGQYDLTPGENVLQALARAGGIGIFANEDGIYVVRQKPVPQRVRFRYTDLVNGDTQSIRFELADGDIIVVE